MVLRVDEAISIKSSISVCLTAPYGLMIFLGEKKKKLHFAFTTRPQSDSTI